MSPPSADPPSLALAAPSTVLLPPSIDAALCSPLLLHPDRNARKIRQARAVSRFVIWASRIRGLRRRAVQDYRSRTGTPRRRPGFTTQKAPFVRFGETSARGHGTRISQLGLWTADVAHRRPDHRQETVSS